MSQHNGENGSTLTLEQILEALSLLAQTGSDSDRIRALSLLAKQQGSGPAAVTLPEPLTSAERVQRLARMHACCGPLETRLAFAMANPRLRHGVDANAKAEFEHLPLEARQNIEAVRDLPSLYRRYPETKRPGHPVGYRVSWGPLEKREWCKEQALAIELERHGIGTPQASGSVELEALRAALTDLRGLISLGHLGPFLQGTRSTIEGICGAVDRLLSDPTATYPSMPPPAAEPAPSSPA